MKNIQVIDGALNCTFSFFQATDEEFLLVFPDPRQDIQYAEDLPDLPMQDEINSALQQIWQRPLRKQDVRGIHGTLFYQLERYKKTYREKREDAVDPSAINPAQRRTHRARHGEAGRIRGASSAILWASLHDDHFARDTHLAPDARKI
jgi:hypothetical protein